MDTNPYVGSVFAKAEQVAGGNIDTPDTRAMRRKLKQAFVGASPYDTGAYFDHLPGTCGYFMQVPFEALFRNVYGDKLLAVGGPGPVFRVEVNFGKIIHRTLGGDFAHLPAIRFEDVVLVVLPKPSSARFVEVNTVVLPHRTKYRMGLLKGLAGCLVVHRRLMPRPDDAVPGMSVFV